MKTTITAKATFLHGQAGKYEEMLKDGKQIKDQVFLKDTGAFIEASIGGDVIGNVVTEGYTVPKVYTATVEGLGDEPKSFLISVDSGAEASGGDYASEIEACINRGFTEEEVRERIGYCEEEKIHPGLVKLSLDFLSKHGDPENCCQGPKDGPIFRNPDTSKMSPIQKMLAAAFAMIALILFGEKSTGKNIASRTIAWLLGLPEYRQGLQRDMDIDGFFGGKGTDNSAAENLKVELAKAWVEYNTDPKAASDETKEKAAMWEFYTAKNASLHIVQLKSALILWAKHGGVMMFDEINMCNANILQMVMNPLADTDKTLCVPGGERIKLHPACVLFGGMNPGYAGTMELNKATASRCGFVEFYEAPSIKAQLEVNFKGRKLPSKYFAACDTLYKDFKAAVSQGRISNDCLNIRGFVNALELVSVCPEAIPLYEAIDTTVIGACTSDERTVLRAMLRDKIIF